MKKFKVIFFLLICITWAFDCHGRPETDRHNESRSSSIFEQKCSNCHEANKSRMLLKDEKAWEETLFRMSKKQGAHITKSDVEKLVRNGDEITSSSRRIDLGQICSISNHKS